MRASGAIVATTVMALAGCSVAVADDGERVASSGEFVTRGDVAVQRVVSLGDGAETQAVTSRVSARFLQLPAGLDDAWVAMLVDVGKTLPAVGTCSERGTPMREPLPDGSPESPIELLDVGDVMIHAGPSTMPLAARAFPDVGDLVSGVVYTSRDESTELPAGVPYLLETTGSALVHGFRIALEPPAELLDLTINGERLRDGDPVVVLSEHLDLGWVRDEDHGSDTLVLVEITAIGDPATATVPPLRCMYADTGSARVAPLQGVLDPASEMVDVSVHRLRRVVAMLPEIDEAAVEFDFVVAGRVPVVAAP